MKTRHLEKNIQETNALDLLNAQNGIIAYDWNIRTGLMSIREPFQESTIPGQNVIARTLIDSMIHPEDRPGVLTNVRNDLQDKNYLDLEYRILAGPDRYIWVRDHAGLIRPESGGDPGIRGLLINISTLKESAETLKHESLIIREELRRSEEEKTSILHGLEGLVHIRYLDPELRILWDNSELAPESMSKKDLSELTHCYADTHGTTAPCSDCPAIEAFVTGTRRERENTREDGQTYMRRCNPVRDAAGAVAGIIHIALNVTKHRKTEEGLRIINAFLHSLLENSPTPVCVTDPGGRVKTVNKAWEKTFGIPEAKTVNRLLHSIFDKETADRLTSANDTVLSSDSSFETEALIDSPTGAHHFHVVKFPLQDGTGKTNAVGSIFVDVTERKKAQEELTKSEAELRNKSVQLGEINTALRVLLKQRETDQQEFEQRIVSNVKEFVLPYVNKLRQMHPTENQLSYIEIIEAHLDDIITPFLRQAVSLYPHMTAKELQIATLVREGKANKDIADFMNISLNTVELHRYNLRKKLGILNKKVNLRSFLLSLNKQDFTS